MVDVFRRGLRQILLVSTACAVLAAPLAAGASESSVQLAQADPVPAVRFSIPAQSLDTALTAFADQAGLKLLFSAPEAKGLSTPGLSATLTPAEALNRLLAGSGFVWRFTDSKTVTLEKVAGDGAMTLDPVTVEGSATAGTSPSAVSEGTGSYAARAVTIGKTEQTLREIPQSVSVVTRQRMDDQHLTTVPEALRSATGVSTYGYEGDVAYARGFQMSEQQNGIQRQGRADDVSYDLAIFDRLEVLRGPSGLLSGSGEPGGTVNYVRKRPLDHFAVSGSVSGGSWDNYRGEADVTGPFNESGTLRGRIVGAYKDGDTFYDVGGQKRQTVYGVMEFDATPKTTIGLTAIHAQKDQVNFWGLPTYADGSLPGRSSFVGMDAESKILLDEVGADVKHRFDNDWEAKLSAFRQSQDYGGYGAYGRSTINTTTGLASVAAGYIETNHVFDGVDASLSGPIHLFGLQHTLTVGYNWSGYDYLGGSNYDTTSYTSVNPLTFHDFNLSKNIATKSRTITEQSGVYSVARVKLADPVTVIMGGRLTDYSSKSRREGAAPTSWTKSKAEADGEFTPFGGAVVDVTKQISVYASYADIFVPQSEMDANDNVLDPRIGWQVETGVKGSFYDGQLTASLAAFRIRDQNRATEAGTGCSTGTCWRAAGELQTQGFEAEIGGSPLPGLDLTAAYTYVDATYLDDPSLTGGRYGANVTPKHLLKLWGHYRFGEELFAGDLAGWSVGAGVVAQSATYTSTIHQDAYAIASAKIGYDINSFLSAHLNIENLFDEKYLRSVGSTGFYNMYGAPRNATLTLTAKW
jgi:TonB-dependent siderophore receptor